MTFIRKITCLLPLAALLIVAGCGADTPPERSPGDRREIAELTQGIMALGPAVDPEEAARAARIAVTHPRQLAQEYQITDPPLVHNTKVNMGLRPRGLCWHWAEDMEKRLRQENFRTLDLHRAIANSDATFRIEHSTAIISQRGDGMYEGIVLDPWRYGGILFWSPTRTDPRYEWHPRAAVLARKRQEGQVRLSTASVR